jgi:hypothetical protein
METCSYVHENVEVGRRLQYQIGAASPGALSILTPTAGVAVLPFADFNQDGSVGLQDYILFQSWMFTVDPRGDVSGSGGVVDLADFTLFAQWFGWTAPE